LRQETNPQRRTRIGIAGAQGRMGSAVVSLSETRRDIAIGSVFGRPAAAGEHLGGRVLSTCKEALAECDVIIDFTDSAASSALAAASAACRGPALVIGSTGFSSQDDAVVHDASRHIAIVRSGNFSLGVNLLVGLVEQAARHLDSADWDIEILEAHHRRKIDAPSGTALLLGEAAARGRGGLLNHATDHGLVAGPRVDGAIGFSVMRGGGIVGEHSVIFAAQDEILTLSHSARDRSLFARGALQAALWVRGREPGLYDMMDVLGFREQPGPSP
jgi:4-hydroxy-tetrahydrodipicolinate reductase